MKSLNAALHVSCFHVSRIDLLSFAAIARIPGSFTPAYIMAKKEITVQFNLQAPGGTATPAPPIGPALGQHGVNPGQFIQQFNAATAALKGKVVGVLVTVYKDRTFSFEVKSPPASVLLKDAVKAEKGSGEPNKYKIGKLTMAQCKALAKEKIKDLNAFDEDHAARILAGTARSMGITVEG